MNRTPRVVRPLFPLLLGALCALAPAARAQDDAGPPPIPDSTSAFQLEKFDNLYQGQFTPGQGFDIIRTERGTLNISVYGLFRYLNQMPGEQTFTDHLGRERPVKARKDLNWHRTMVWLTGFFYDPRFRYNITLWSLPTTQQTLLFGNLRYLMDEKLTFGVGLGPNLTNRSMQGSWPFWAASDRQMGEEFSRGGFSSSAWITGKLSRAFYTFSVNTNLSQLGVTAANDTRDLAYSGSLWWHPTTGEFGPRNGFGDLEHHDRLATQIGVSSGSSHESRYAAISQAPNATQIRLSDGIFPFETGALAESVTVERLRYRNISFDLGAKYRGFSFQSEFTYRILSDFEANGPLPLSEIHDRSVFAEASYMVVPKKLALYTATSYVWDEFEREPYEICGGASFYPFGNRNWRLNLHYIHVEKSAAGSNFGYYAAGQTGNTISFNADILL